MEREGLERGMDGSEIEMRGREDRREGGRRRDKIWGRGWWRRGMEGSKKIRDRERGRQ